ncbi:hypothetical protein Peur_057114 [Populus x canadensis]
MAPRCFLIAKKRSASLNYKSILLIYQNKLITPSTLRNHLIFHWLLNRFVSSIINTQNYLLILG